MSGPPSQDANVVCIPQEEYTRLTETEQRYARLRTNLVRGGVDDKTLDLLSNDEGPVSPTTGPASRQTPKTKSSAHDNAARLKPCDGTSNDSHHAEFFDHRRKHMQQAERLDWADDETPYEDYSPTTVSPIDSVHDGYQEPDPPNPDPPKPSFERLATRTIQLLSLPEHVRLAEVIAAVRGGMLLDIWLRRDNVANVSFVHGEDAKAFHEHVCKHGLCIRNKMVDIKWADRQYTLRPSVAHKLARGATRNFVIRRCGPDHTEKNIRDDLEHIHNLVVVKISFIKGDCFISANSVHTAMFARTCMMSRASYKGSSFEWYADECAEPLPQASPPSQTVTAPPSKKRLNPLANRFEVLSFDDNTPN